MNEETNAGGQEPKRLASNDLVGVSEIHDLLLRICRERVLELTYRDDFPQPVAELFGGDVWLRNEVEVWIEGRGDVVADLFKAAR